MIGISEEIAGRYSEAELERLFGVHAHHGEIRVRYARPNGDLTAPLPSSRHMAYVAKGWTAVSIAEEPAPADTTPIVLTADMREHATHDRVGVWKRGDARIESSCRNAFTLIAKGYQFVGLADEQRRRAVPEARPIPTATATTQSEPAGPPTSTRK